MLAGAGNGHGDVQVGRDRLAGQTHLVVGGNPAGVHGGARRSHGSAQQAGQLFQLGEGLGSAEAAPAGHDDPGVLQLDALGLFLHHIDHAGLRGGGIDIHGECHHLSAATGVSIQGFVGLGPESSDLRRLGAAHHGDGAAAIHRAVGQQATGFGIGGHFQTVLCQSYAQAERQARSQFAALVVSCNENDARVGL